MTPNKIFDLLHPIAFEIAKEESLPLKEIVKGCKKARGLCHSDGRIEIRSHSSSTMSFRARLQEDTRTFAHELAHLKHMNHEIPFWKYAAELCKKFEDKLKGKGIEFPIPPEKYCLR